MSGWRIGGLGLLILVGLAGVPVAADDGEALFRKEIAPMLESRCVRCHSGEKPKGGLSLESREALDRGSDAGPVLEPGNAEESILLDVVTGDAPTMPQGSEPLSEQEVAGFRKWIEQGAPWPNGLLLEAREDRTAAWWSLRPLERIEPPQPGNSGWVRNPIDAFVLERLSELDLEPSPEVDRRRYIRRVTFDLTGLPPMPEEVDAFLMDDRTDAYERLVERLLGSEAYGERWARHWLDVVHYADTHGYDKDKRRDHAWRYRDYVIRALNEDKPYGQFVREQLAGDVLRPGDPEGVVATGFVVAGPWDFVGHVELREGTVDKKKTRVIDRDDMVTNALSTFSSLTVHCARCHDHKFDPISQVDYYRLQAVFAGVERADRTFDLPEVAEHRRALQEEKKTRLAEQEELSRRIASLVNPGIERINDRLREAHEELKSLPAEVGEEPSTSNGYHSAIEANPDVKKWVQVDLGEPKAIEQVILLPARPVDFPDTPGFGFPARWKLELANEPEFREPIVLADFTAIDFENPGDQPVVVSGSGQIGQYVRWTATRLWPRTQDYVAALSELVVMADGQNAALGKPVTSADSIEAGRWGRINPVDGQTSRARLLPLDSRNASVAWSRRLALQGSIDQMQREQARLREEAIDSEMRFARAENARRLTEIEQELLALPEPETAYAVSPISPRTIHVLHRGDVEQEGEEVQPGGLSCLEPVGLSAKFSVSPKDDEGQRRAALAAWITDPRNPLTWRSIVNRVWHYHFGLGLVETPSDFGRNGGRPSHPELLDWLAVELRDDPGQSLKRLHRMIVLSATYRQESTIRPEAAALDAGNRWLWRQNRRRLEAETIRDAILSVSGTLDRQMGGPGFALFRFKDDHSPIYDHDDPAWIDPPEGRRRTIYRFSVRSVTNPFLDCLDGADPNVGVPVRNETVTALQALALLNDPFILSQAEAFADRLKREEADFEGQIDRAFALAIGRAPTGDESALMTDYAREHGLAAACRLLFNLNEFVLVD